MQHAASAPPVVDDASDATSSASEGLSEPPPKKPAVKRKATYYQRKDEIDALEKEVKALKEELRVTQQNSLVAAREALARMDSPTLRAFHDDAIARNNLKLAGTQAMLSSYNQTLGSMDAVVPLSTYIYLPKDPDARQNILNALRHSKLQSTIEFMGERTRGLNLAVAQSQKEKFDLPNGELATTGFVVSHIDSGHSLRQVFEAFMYFVRNQEISISEELGVLTIRDSDESEFRCGQCRFLSTLPEGIEIEQNAAMFAACVDGTNVPCRYAVGAIDFVDQDDLYPYSPDERARKDFSGAMVMTEIPSISDATNIRPTIAISWWYYVRLRPPTLGMDAQTRKSAHASIARWHEVAIKVMRDRLATVAPV